METRQTNIEVFLDTEKRMRQHQTLANAIEFSKKNQRLYLEKESLVIPSIKSKKNTKIFVSQKRSLEAAESYAKKGKRVCVLNFASATNPGGGVRKGSSAQEEAICRCSTLLPCLETRYMFYNFYLPHRKTNNPLYNDDCIYTPGIISLKTDYAIPKVRPEEEWYSIDILTCAAPNLRKKPSNIMNPNGGIHSIKIENKELENLLEKRIDRIFQVSIYNNVEVLILGAFGCGAFKNSPEMVSNIFAKVQKKYEGYFDTIEYAVFCSRTHLHNYNVFEKTLNDKKIK